jgi:predicted enzyme related to lactoylglutathione lyase
MERVATSLFLILVGGGLLALSRGFWRDGELPAGTSAFKPYRPTRANDPFAFHFFLALYAGSDGVLLVWGLLALLGLAPRYHCIEAVACNRGRGRGIAPGSWCWAPVRNAAHSRSYGRLRIKRSAARPSELLSIPLLQATIHPIEAVAMSEINSAQNRVIWCDIPVADLDRAIAFYRSVLGISVDKMEFNAMTFALLEHNEGNGGCLVPHPGYAGCVNGPLVYMNVDRRIRAAVVEVEKHGGKVLEAIHPIGPHGHRAIVLDSEGTRIALHSTVDA